MKAFILTTGSLCLVVIALLLYANLRPAPVAPVASVPLSVAETNAPPRTTIPAAKKSSPPANLASTNQPRHYNAPRRADAPAPDNSGAFRRAMDTLVSPQSSFQEKQAAWKQLLAAGQLDDAIAALKQGMTDNPASPEYAAALGEAQLQKAGVVSKNGGSVNELGILGMSADQNFDAALKIDPSNWDAQFFKAVAMSYWPTELNKGDEVVQRFSNLINQQQTMSDQPEFANTYLALGNEYQKLGQTDNALQTWQAGAAKFPNDAALQQKLTAAASPP